jgi:hypothetical protein
MDDVDVNESFGNHPPPADTSPDTSTRGLVEAIAKQNRWRRDEAVLARLMVRLLEARCGPTLIQHPGGVDLVVDATAFDLEPDEVAAVRRITGE